MQHITVALMPLLKLLIFMILLYIVKLLLRRKKVQNYVYVQAVIMILYIDYPEIVQQLIQGVSCERLGEFKYVMADPKYFCNDRHHLMMQRIFYIPALIFLVILVPFGCTLFLRINKSKLDSLSFSLRYGIIYQDYNIESYFWEVLKSYIKICLVFCGCYWVNSFKYQMIIVSSVLILYLFLLLIFKPYDYDSANSLEILSTLCGIINILCIYGFTVSNDSAITTYLTLLTFISNLVFLALMVKYFMSYQIEYLVSTYVKFKREISAKYPKLRRLLNQKELKVLRSWYLWENLRKSVHKFIRMKKKDKKYNIEQLYENQRLIKEGSFGGQQDSGQPKIMNSFKMKISEKIQKIREKVFRCFYWLVEGGERTGTVR